MEKKCPPALFHTHTNFRIAVLENEGCQMRECRISEAGRLLLLASLSLLLARVHSASTAVAHLRVRPPQEHTYIWQASELSFHPSQSLFTQTQWKSYGSRWKGQTYWSQFGWEWDWQWWKGSGQAAKRGSQKEEYLRNQGSQIYTPVL